MIVLHVNAPFALRPSCCIAHVPSMVTFKVRTVPLCFCVPTACRPMFNVRERSTQVHEILMFLFLLQLEWTPFQYDLKSSRLRSLTGYLLARLSNVFRTTDCSKRAVNNSERLFAVLLTNNAHMFSRPQQSCVAIGNQTCAARLRWLWRHRRHWDQSLRTTPSVRRHPP